MEQTFDFDEIRPYEGEEVAAAAERLCKEELFCKAIAYVVPDTEAFLHTLSACRTVDDFQLQLALPFLNALAKNTSAGLTHAGFPDFRHKGVILTYPITGISRSTRLFSMSCCMLMSLILVK